MRIIPFLLLLGAGVSPHLAAQSVPATINCQGRLTDNTPSQSPVNTTTNMQFEIWDVASGGSASPNRLWREPNLDNAAVLVPVTGGIFSYSLGTTVAIPPAIFAGASSTRYLQIIINPGASQEILTPRQLISAAGYANLAENANSAAVATTAATAGDAANLGGVAAVGYQLATTQTCSDGQYINTISPSGVTTCGAPATNNLAPPVVLTYNGSSTVFTVNNNGGGNSLQAVAASGSALAAYSTGTTATGVLGVSGNTGSYWADSGVSGYSAAGQGVSGMSNTGYAVRGYTNGAGRAGYFQISSAANANAALTGITSGSGEGVYAENTGLGVSARFRTANAANTASTIEAINEAGGRAGHFQITGAGNASVALLGQTNGTGVAVQGYVNSTATAIAMQGFNNGAGKAGDFVISQAANAASALSAVTAGTGRAGYFEINNAANNSAALTGVTNGDGDGVFGQSAGNNGVAAFSASTGDSGIYAENTGLGVTARFRTAVNPANTAATVEATNTAAGSAGIFQITNSANTAAAVTGSTNGAGAGVRAVGSAAAGTALQIETGGIKVAGAGIGTSTTVFTHLSAAANITSNRTAITHPLTDNRPNAILIVTHNFNPAGVTGTVNNHAVGVYYIGGKWTIYNEDIAAMPVGTYFNVLVITP